MTAQPPKNDRTPYNLSDALRIAMERFLGSDITQQCRRTGALYSPEIVTLNYLNEIYRIDILSAEISFVDSKSPVPQRDKILILHYFTQAQGTPLTGKQISFRDLPGGLVYYPTFIKRTIEPLAEVFGKNPALLVGVGQMLGSRRGETGDAALAIDAFAKVPVNIILWQGDEELKPEVNLLFDANILDYLSTEDITIMCEAITWQLINFAKKV